MMPDDHARQTGPALEAMYRFMLWLIPTQEKFPRSQRFLLGDRIQTAAMDGLDLLVEANLRRFRDRLRICATATARVPSPSPRRSLGLASVVQGRS